VTRARCQRVGISNHSDQALELVFDALQLLTFAEVAL
jgi:hypothetical protein